MTDNQDQPGMAVEWVQDKDGWHAIITGNVIADSPEQAAEIIRNRIAAAAIEAGISLENVEIKVR